MSLKGIKKDELETMSNKDIACLILEESKRKLNTADLFKKIMKLLLLSPMALCLSGCNETTSESTGPQDMGPCDVVVIDGHEADIIRGEL